MARSATYGEASAARGPLARAFDAVFGSTAFAVLFSGAYWIWTAYGIAAPAL